MAILLKRAGELISWVRGHPKLALWATLSFLLIGTIEDVFFDGVKAILYELLGNFLAVGDVIALARFVSKVVIPTAIAGGLVYTAFLVGRRGSTTRGPGAAHTTVPLLEAAKQAYEATRGTLVADIAEIQFGDEDDRQESTLTWFCWALADRLTIYGNWPPSRIPEKIDWPTVRKRHSFKIRDGALIFQEHHSDGYYENLHVLTRELPQALAEVRALAPMLEFVWPNDRALNWTVGKDRTDFFLIVRNLSTTTPAKGVYVVREWMMRAEHREAGGSPQRDEVRLPLQFGLGDTKDIEPGGKERFRFFSIANTSDDDHMLIVPSNKTPGGYNAGTGTFQFQVRARAQNASSASDLYEIGLSADGGFTTARKTDDTIEV